VLMLGSGQGLPIGLRLDLEMWLRFRVIGSGLGIGLNRGQVDWKPTKSVSVCCATGKLQFTVLRRGRCCFIKSYTVAVLSFLCKSYRFSTSYRPIGDGMKRLQK